MRVLLSTLIASASAAHGGPVLAWRQAAALRRCGAHVRIAAPQVVGGADPAMADVDGYEPGSVPWRLFRHWRFDAQAVEGVRRIVERFRPDVLYDVHGPAWAIDAALRSDVPVVSMIGDYNWFCRRSFLVDASLRRCSGPDSTQKCFDCVGGERPLKVRIAQQTLKRAATAGMSQWPLVRMLAPYDLWSALEESSAYAAGLRERVGRFIVGDRKAEAFLVEHGVPAEKLHRIAQCLPEEALRSRRPARDGLGTGRALRIVYVGRVDPDKGLHVLTAAFEAISPDVALELWIAHAEAATEERVRPLFRDAQRFDAGVASGRIRLVRPRDREELYRLMAQADVGVVPSIAFESPSLVMLELVAQRTPVVRSESAGMDHVIQDGVNGRTFPYGHSEALKAILLEIAANPGLLREWQARLPVIGSDASYAGSLMRAFAAATRDSRAVSPSEVIP